MYLLAHAWKLMTQGQFFFWMLWLKTFKAQISNITITALSHAARGYKANNFVTLKSNQDSDVSTTKSKTGKQNSPFCTSPLESWSLRLSCHYRTTATAEPPSQNLKTARIIFNLSGHTFNGGIFSLQPKSCEQLHLKFQYDNPTGKHQRQNKRICSRVQIPAVIKNRLSSSLK